MPLLMCPNDDAPMQAVERSGVQFDTCPTCRGVWLDRGELEKLMESAASDAPAASATRQAPAQRQAPPPHYGHGERGERGEHGERGHYRRQRPSIFDIFD